jgi:hypothetical protein
MELSRALREITAILSTESVDADLSRTARLLAEFCDAEAAVISLAFPDTAPRDYWSGEATPFLRERVATILATAASDTKASIPTAPDEAGEHWLWAVPLLGPDGRIGSIAILFDDPQARSVATKLPLIDVATLLAMQIVTQTKMSALRSEKQQRNDGSE